MNLKTTIPLALAFALLWWVLTAGDAASWIVGGPAVVAATVLSRRLAQTHSYGVRLGAASGYVLFFIGASVRGGWDVALRALLPGRRPAPLFLYHQTMLPPGWPRALLANTVSLLPGTLTADIDGDRLTVHALSEDLQALAGIHDCETRIARMLSAPVAEEIRP